MCIALLSDVTTKRAQQAEKASNVPVHSGYLYCCPAAGAAEAESRSGRPRPGLLEDPIQASAATCIALQSVRTGISHTLTGMAASMILWSLAT